MARATAVGDAPVVFFTGAGQQLFLPLSDIEFEGDVAHSKSDTSDALLKWLKYLVTQGRLVAAPTPAPGAAMVFTARSAGSTGNNIVVKVTANSATSVDVTVTETDLYEGLTLDSASPDYLPTVIGVSGTPGTTGTRPGLVRVKPLAATPPDPEEVDAEPVLPVVGHIPTWTVAAAGAAPAPTSFTLEARDAGSDAGVWAIRVTDVEPAGAGRATFTLEVKWTKTVTIEAADLAVDPSDSASKLFPLAFAVTITRPAGSASLLLPRPGSVNLRGGAEVARATKAEATLLASS